MKLAPEIYTDKIIESKKFYCDYLGFRIKQEMEGFIVLEHKNDPAYEILFCIPNSLFVNEIFRPKFQGQGLIFQMTVDNVDAEYRKIRVLPIEIVLDLVEEPVNGRHFTIKDPNGILIDIVQFT